MPLALKRLVWLAGGLLLALLAWQLVFQGAFQALSLQLVAWQRDFHRALTLAITGLSGTPSPATWATLLGISFGYGVFHAAGPGHGKAVLTTYLVSQGGARRRALALSCAASLLQGLVAIFLVVGLVHGLGWLTRQATLLDNFMVGVAAVLVMSLGTALTVSALALASVVARGWAERRLASQQQARRAGRLLGWGALAGGLAIVALGVSLTATGVGQPASAPLLGEPPSRSATAPLDTAPHPFGG